MKLTPILNTVVRFLDEVAWSYEMMDDATALNWLYQGENGARPCFCYALEEQRQCVFYSIYQLPAPPEKRPAVAEYLTRANYSLVIGNFEMDFADGEIRFKTSIDVEGDALSVSLVRQLVYINLLMTDRYLPGLLEILSSDVSPEEAIARLES